ncbi:MAG: hypothetical protein ACE5KT_05010 [Methanosarcinales archaeon]
MEIMIYMPGLLLQVEVPVVVKNGTFTVKYHPPTIHIYTDKASYSTGDLQKLGLDLKNPDLAQSVIVKIWLSGPRYYPLIDQQVTLPEGLNYSKPEFKKFKLPNLPSGTYTWNAQLIEAVTSVIISEDAAKWNFTASPTANIVEFTKFLE